jgi:hypothetical protein
VILGILLIAMIHFLLGAMRPVLYWTISMPALALLMLHKAKSHQNTRKYSDADFLSSLNGIEEKFGK